ncbi:MAG: hydroxymethylbilane synthase [Acidobacteria bacterium]|nr:hydroxymethylbilane synthase [Acidobacteriota bacterium]MBM4197959.1 hydroxymethylbilane synthase [Gammaproteobacteria bacterium]
MPILFSRGFRALCGVHEAAAPVERKIPAPAETNPCPAVRLGKRASLQVVAPAQSRRFIDIRPPSVARPPEVLDWDRLGRILVIASRGSELALWQARWVQEKLAAQGAESRIEVIRTTGDKMAHVPLARSGIKGLFIKEIEEALLEGRADLAVHSLKDLPTELPAGLVLAAVPEREDPRDVLVGARLDELKPGARIGTSSLRRAAQLRSLRPGLAIEPVRGNLDTRVRKLDQDGYHALVLAAAGLKRLGMESKISEFLSPRQMCPAPGQGALAIEAREGEAAAARLDHPPSRAAVVAERALLSGLGGGCQAPIGAYAEVRGANLVLQGVVVTPDGRRSARGQVEGDASRPEALGCELARRLLEQGGRDIMDMIEAAPSRDPAV